MSREKECKCCHEWWYASVIKEDLCPNCYDYFKQLKQQLEEKDKEIKSLIADYEKRISQEQELMSNMEHRLVEKQNTIDEINKEFVRAVHDWKTLCAEKDKEIKKLNWQLKDKDFIIKNLNHSLSVAPNANAGQRARIDELTKIVKEKDKEIEKLKQQYTILENENGKLTTELIMDKYKKAQKEVSFGKQLAIAELEKVKDWLNEPFDEDGCFKIGGDLIDFIDQQISELKGE